MATLPDKKIIRIIYEYEDGSIYKIDGVNIFNYLENLLQADTILASRNIAWLEVDWDRLLDS